MSESVFSRVFSYRQRENHSPTENYLTEIFAFCLESDIGFRNDFLKELEIPFSEESIKITTQEIYETYGQPDIEINFGDTCILIECKVEANERLNQLEDYCLILCNEKKHSNKHIVYLTKY